MRRPRSQGSQHRPPQSMPAAAQASLPRHPALQPSVGDSFTSSLQRFQLACGLQPFSSFAALIAAPSADSALRTSAIPRILLIQFPRQVSPIRHFPLVPARGFPANLPNTLADPPASLLTNVGPRMSVHSWPPVHGPCPVTCVTRQGLSWLGHAHLVSSLHLTLPSAGSAHPHTASRDTDRSRPAMRLCAS